jgi:RNA polymerase sigma-70 factor (ECF subfamily)
MQVTSVILYQAPVAIRSSSVRGAAKREIRIMSSPANEELIIASARQGDMDAFNRLVMAYQQLAFNVAYRILNSEDNASDATQDAFLRAYRALGQFRGGSFKVWLLRIVTNCCYDQLRLKQRRPTTSIDDLVDSDEHSRIFEDPMETPDERMERLDLDAALRIGLETLPAEQRAVLVLSDIDGLSYDEIAAVTSVSLGTVKSRLSRARSKLRDYLIMHQELLPSRFRLRGE